MVTPELSLARNLHRIEMFTGFPTRFENMKTLIDESRTLYAAIQSCCPDGAVERFVISYTSEQALRELLAARSIVASGCTTRERAEELCRGEALRAIEINHESRSRSLRCRGIEPRNSNDPEILRLCKHASRVGKRFILRLYGFFLGGRYFFSTEATTT